MKIKVLGEPTQEGLSKQLIHKATHFMMCLLIHDNEELLNSITIEVELVEGMIAETGNGAVCRPEYEMRNPVDFVVMMDNGMDKATTLKALGHELVHVRQWANGWKSQSLDGTKHRWMGQVIDHYKLDYYELPWEIEAHGMEYGLYARFTRFENGEDAKASTVYTSESYLSAMRLITNALATPVKGSRRRQ